MVSVGLLLCLVKETLEVDATRYARYRRAVEAGLAAYRRRYFAGREALFEPGPRGEPVYRVASAHLNFFDPALYHALTQRPRAFRRLGDARVLAISVFGTLARREDLTLLAEVPCDDGRPVLPEAGERAWALELQQRTTLPGRGAPLIVDLWLHPSAPAPEPGTAERSPGSRVASGGDGEAVASGPTLSPRVRGGIVAVHGRLLEREVGPVGRMAGAVHAAGPRGAVLVVYDARNPAFEPGRQCDRSLKALQAELGRAVRLRRTSWQAIAGAMARSPWYADLLDYLKAKYGVEPEG